MYAKRDLFLHRFSFPVCSIPPPPPPETVSIHYITRIRAVATGDLYSADLLRRPRTPYQGRPSSFDEEPPDGPTGPRSMSDDRWPDSSSRPSPRRGLPSLPTRIPTGGREWRSEENSLLLVDVYLNSKQIRLRSYPTSLVFGFEYKILSTIDRCASNSGTIFSLMELPDTQRTACNVCNLTTINN